ncbi:MAG: protein kinase [Acidobacteria bacterium]|nr:protein kinase [Acidobacteriota bacterium]
MGEVYLAHDTRLGRKIALKVLPADLINSSERLRRFEQEARAASALNHQNILTIYEIGAEGDTHFIATEFIEGKTLRQKMQTARFEIEETLNIAIQIATALDAAHRSGIVHRDIKTENVMVRTDGLAKVLDFGLAKLTEKKDDAAIDTEAPTRAQVQTSPGVVMGTVAYMSPEQARGLEVDARTDIFSLGIVLYEMLAGRLPFTGATASDVIAAILKTEPAPLSGFNQEIPAELERIVSKTLEKDREERYQTAKDLLVDLRRLKKQLEIQSETERTTSQKKTASENATQILTARPTSRATSSAGGIQKHKLGFALALSVLLLTAIGLGYWFYSQRSSTATQIESIAVLPFVNEGGNADVEYLSDGMTETLINSLSQLPKLSVKARSSVFSYKGRDAKPQQVGSDLNVQAVLSGRVVQRGDDLTLYLSLVDARNGNQLWGEQYNRKLADLVSLQGEIARDVSQKLRMRLSGADEQKLAKSYTQNAEAYRLYLRGRYSLNGSRDGLQQSVEHFQRAIDLDPNFALGYAGMADAYTLLGTTFFSMTPREAMPRARAAAQRALELDSGLSETHTSLAWVKYRFDWDWRGAEDEFKQALLLNPSNAQAHHWYADYLLAMGRFDESLAENRRARGLDPLSLFINWDAGRILYHALRYDESLAELHKTLEMDQNFAWTHAVLHEVYLAKGMNDEALAAHLKFAALTGVSPERVAALKNVYVSTGWKGLWQKELEWALEDSKHRRVTPHTMATLYAKIGDKDHTLEWLNKAFEERAASLVYLNTDQQWDNFRQDPRFADLVRRVGLPQ